MRLTRKRRRRNPLIEFIVMMVFCFVVGYSMRGILDTYPVILWCGLGVFVLYALLLFVAMIILIKQKKEELEYKLETMDALEEGLDEWDWIIEAFEIGQRVLKKLCHCFIVIGGVFFVCNIVILKLPKENIGVTLTKQDLEEIVLQNHAKLLENNVELQQGLKADYYNNATKEEQLKVLMSVLITESFYLGIEAPSLRATVLEDTLGGYYQADIHAIVINEKNLSNEEKVLNTLLHEMYHAYQHTCVEQLDMTGDLLWAKQVKQWKEEFEQSSQNTNTNEGMITYYTQSIEESAREYAKQRLPVYLYYME